MKKLLLPALVLLLAAISQAQTPVATGNLTAQASSCGIAATTACISLPFSSATGAATITLSGSFSATVQFEALGADGATWVAINGTPLNSTTAVTSASTTGVWQFNPSGAIAIRARCSAFTSGTISVAIHVSTASA